MANYTPNPLVLPDPLALSTGSKIADPNIQRLALAYNHAMANLRAAPVITQAFEDDVLKYESVSALPVDAIFWRIPLISSAHTTLRIHVLAKCTAVGGYIEFKSLGAASSSTIITNSVPEVWYSTSITTSAFGPDYDRIVMALQADIGKEITVLSVTAEIEPLTVPGGIISTLVDGAEPMGVSSWGSDYSLNAAMAYRMIEGLETFKSRPRVLFQWSGVTSDIDTYAGGGGRLQTIGTYDHTAWAPVNPPVYPDAFNDVVIHARVLPLFAESTEIAISDWRKTVVSGVGDRWENFSSIEPLRLSQMAIGSFGRLVGRRRFSELLVGFAGDQATTPNGSTAHITNLSIWGV